ncbi:hypothetical protein M8J75_000079 [Diaphorina citri]|nr:hypothetical protein M8J75_000079 [Diaphorina citri]
MDCKPWSNKNIIDQDPWIANPGRTKTSSTRIHGLQTLVEQKHHRPGSMDCKPWSNKNIIDQVIYTCPKPFVNTDAQAYCCYDKDGNSYCCELPEFLASTTAYLIVFLLIVLLVTSLISCVCCLCCPCCCLYKRRQSGGGIC